MPGMPIFQDSPSQLKGQIYVLDNINDSIVPLQVDGTGNLAINGTVDLATGAEVALAAGTEVTLAAGADIDNIASVTVVDTITNDVKIVNGTTELSVGLTSGTNVIGKVESELVFTNVDTFGEATPLTSKTVGVTATVEANAQDISQESSYNWFIKNTGITSADQDITLKVELSPDNTNWIEDTGSTITVAFDTSKMITVTNFLQYVRFVITGGAAETTVISCFQAQH
ncbi:MAG: DUF6385 domain-containing protein [Eubacteriales bacterium]